MSKKGKLLIFDRIEIVLILFLVCMTAVIAFTYGVKVGRSYADLQNEVLPEDRQAIAAPVKGIELKSQEEEEVDKLINSEAAGKEKEEGTPKKIVANNKLAKEFSTLDQGKKPEIPPETIKAQNRAKRGESGKAVANDSPRAKYVGKHTIQLGSFKKLNDAKQFADGYKVLGYNPIINEVDLKNKGVWFRVSVGAFDSEGAAKEYIKKEESLFQGQNYVITEIN